MAKKPEDYLGGMSGKAAKELKGRGGKIESAVNSAAKPVKVNTAKKTKRDYGVY